ncbi:MAG: acetyl-coenzyme A synthetase N-terminal domain-containing protein, partial [Methylobacter sp.]
MSDDKIYDIKPEIAAKAHITAETYKTLYQRSIAEPEAFWAEQAELFLDWDKPWDKVTDCDFKTGHIRW